jgi:hypothetical protein
MRRTGASFVYTTNQSRVTAWVNTTFTKEEAENAPERALRTAEEAIELAQAVGVDAETLHRLVDYVFSRPVGKPEKEIAGTMVTIYAMAAAIGADAQAEFETEIVRINTPEVIERCRRRQHEKREALAPMRQLNLGESWTGDTCPSPSLLAEALAAPRELTPFEGAKKRPQAR